MKNPEKEDRLVRSVYSFIRNHNGKVTAKHLKKEVGSMHKVRYALTRLMKEGKLREPEQLEQTE
jgi:DNA-binding transcriptional regulator PaaX